MWYEITLAPEAVEDLRRLKAAVRAEVEDALQRYLRHQPTRASKSRIKRLHGLSRPQYRLRVGDDIRVFYDILDETVEVFAIVAESHANEWLEEHGISNEESSPDETEG